MKVLILGGTKFVGRLAAMEAVARGHDVTVFNRGSRSAPEGVKSVVGDRLVPGAFSALDDLNFDVIIDTWSSDASAVKSAVEAFRGRIKQFIYVSSVSVYDTESSSAPFSETTPLHDVEKAPVKYITDKVGGELEAVKSGVPTVLARPGGILGPFEDIGRLPWWLSRMAKGGPTLAPAPRELGLQFIDGRDLAKFLVDAVEKQLSGAFNLVSEMNHTTMGDFLETINEVTGGNAQLRWLEADTITAAGIKPWVELPMWLTPGDASVYSNDVGKALESGLQIRPARETIQDTWAWWQSREEVDMTPLRAGLDFAKESALLKEHCDDA